MPWPSAWLVIQSHVIVTVLYWQMTQTYYFLIPIYLLVQTGIKLQPSAQHVWLISNWPNVPDVVWLFALTSTSDTECFSAWLLRVFSAGKPHLCWRLLSGSHMLWGGRAWLMGMNSEGASSVMAWDGPEGIINDSNLIKYFCLLLMDKRKRRQGRKEQGAPFTSS